MQFSIALSWDSPNLSSVPSAARRFELAYCVEEERPSGNPQPPSWLPTNSMTTTDCKDPSLAFESILSLLLMCLCLLTYNVVIYSPV